MKPDKILELTRFQPARILLTAAELDLFTHLAEPLSAHNLASKIGSDPEFTARLLNAMVVLRIIDKIDDKYSIPDTLREALGSGTRTVIPMMRHAARLWKTWSRLTDIVRTGKNYYQLTGEERQDDGSFEAFIRAMATPPNEVAEETAEILSSPDVKSVIDIGAGPAIYIIEFCRRMESASMTILDQPGVREIANDFLSEAGFTDRVKFITGDATTIDPNDVLNQSDGKFDIVFCSNLIHAFSYEKTRTYLGLCAAIAAPGGRIAVKEFYLNDDRVSPMRPPVFDINMMVNTPGGRTYTWLEIEEMMLELTDPNGEKLVENVERIELSDGASGIVVGHVKN